MKKNGSFCNGRVGRGLAMREREMWVQWYCPWRLVIKRWTETSNTTVGGLVGKIKVQRGFVVHCDSDPIGRQHVGFSCSVLMLTCHKSGGKLLI